MLDERHVAGEDAHGDGQQDKDDREQEPALAERLLHVVRAELDDLAQSFFRFRFAGRRDENNAPRARAPAAAATADTITARSTRKRWGEEANGRSVSRARRSNRQLFRRHSYLFRHSSRARASVGTPFARWSEHHPRAPNRCQLRSARGVNDKEQ